MLSRLLNASVLALGLLGCGDRYPDLYDSESLSKIDKVLANSNKYGNNIRFVALQIYGTLNSDGSESEPPLIVEKYIDDDRNFVYVSYINGTEEHEIEVMITRDMNLNDVIDNVELGFEMLNIDDGDLYGPERIGLRWRDYYSNGTYRDRRHGINESNGIRGNNERFSRASELFRKVMMQRNGEYLEKEKRKKGILI